MKVIIIEILISGSSSIGRAIAFQAIGREFETRLPLIFFKFLVELVYSACSGRLFLLNRGS